MQYLYKDDSKSGIMLFVLFSASVAAEPKIDPCSAYNASCMLCMKHADECFYCFQKDVKQYKCMQISEFSTAECTHKSTKLDTQCVEMLGGDAVASTRYIIGGLVIGIGIIIDLIVRFYPKQQPANDYSHL